MKNAKSEISMTEILEGRRRIAPLGETLADRPSAQIVTSDRLADLLGVTAVRVGQLAAEGIIPRVGRNKFDLRAAIRAYAADLRSKATGRATANPAYVDAKVRAASAQAHKIELANAMAAGDLVRASDVAATWAAILTDVRAAMLAVPSRLPELDRRAVERVDEEIRSALEGVADAG